MPGYVRLEIIDGPMLGQEFVFGQRQMFLFGRLKECHAHLADDPLVSRHQFLLEVDPPDVRLRDLGSLNGTHVNGITYRGPRASRPAREGGPVPPAGADLRDGDVIRVGRTRFQVEIRIPLRCASCAAELPGEGSPGAQVQCPACLAQPAPGVGPRSPTPALCSQCGRDVAGETGTARQGAFVCRACSEGAGENPREFLNRLLDSTQVWGPADRARIAGYEFENVLGSGGMGVVYRARQIDTGRPVAVKLMLSKVAVDERSRSLFLREIETLRALRHPQIVEFLAAGAGGGAFFLAMEYCEAGSIDKLPAVHGGRLPLDVARPLMLDVLDGLAQAHAQGFVHRDLKPENILLTESTGRLSAKVSDFGLAKNFQQAGLSGMTMTGTAGGTMRYMPPEQIIEYRFVRPVSDVWSAAAAFYKLLTGELPRDMPPGSDPLDVILNGEAVPLRRRNPELSRRVAAVLDRALAKAPADRFADAGQMRQELARAFE